jgi:hypothetical protein
MFNNGAIPMIDNSQAMGMMSGKTISPSVNSTLTPPKPMYESGIMSDSSMNLADIRSGVEKKISSNIQQSGLPLPQKKEAQQQLNSVGDTPNEMLLDFGTSLMQCDSPYFSDCLAGATTSMRAGKTARKQFAMETQLLEAQISAKRAEGGKYEAETRKMDNVSGGYDPESPLGKKLFDLKNAVSSGRKMDVTLLWKDIMSDVSGGKDSPFAKIDPDKYTPESVKSFMESGDHSLLRSKTTNSSVDQMIGTIPVDKVTSESLDKFVGSGKYSDLKFVEDANDPKMSELHRKIQTEAHYCGINPSSDNCQRAKTDIITYTQRAQKLTDDPISRADDLRKERKKALEGVNGNIAIGHQIKTLLRDDYGAFNTGQAEAIPRLMDNLIETATHSYRSVTDWKALGDIIDRGQSFLTQMSSGKPDRTTWESYHSVVDDLMKFHGEAASQIDKSYSRLSDAMFDDQQHKDIVFGGQNVKTRLNPQTTEMIRAMRMNGHTDDYLRQMMIEAGATEVEANRYLGQ